MTESPNRHHGHDHDGLREHAHHSRLSSRRWRARAVERYRYPAIILGAVFTGLLVWAVIAWR